MFIRSRQDALDAVAEILDLPERRHQIVTSTVKVMMCLEAEQRRFMLDCQALLVEGGLEALKRRRAAGPEPADDEPVIILDPEADRLFESLALGMDALKLTEVVRQVFPDLPFERWQLARALLSEEPEIQALLTTAIKARADEDVLGDARRRVEARVRSHRPIWAERAPALRRACLEAVADRSAADELFELFAISDERTMRLLAGIDSDPGDAAHQLAVVAEMAATVRSTRESLAEDLRQAA